MKILHLSDTHIGYAAYNKLDENGYNQREMDVNKAFEQVIDFALKDKPDLILHTGDVFDSVRPTNRAISFVLEQLLRLSEAGIPIVLIAGNHETPRLRETGSVFRIFEHIEGIFPVYKSQVETFKFNDLEVHALPHCMDKDMFNQEITKLKPNKKFRFNIAMLHAGVVGLSVFKMGEFNEQLAQTGNLHKGFDYIALGHYHKNVDVADNATYAGSMERLGFGEVGQKKGFLTINLEKEKRRFHEVQMREMTDIGPIDCMRKSIEDMTIEIERKLSKIQVKDNILRIKLKGISSNDYHLLDMTSLRKKLKDSLYSEFQVEFLTKDQKIASGDIIFESLETEFAGYIAKTALEGADKNALRAKGIEYLGKAGGVE